LKFLGLLLAIGLSAVSFIAQEASISGAVIKPGAKGVEEPAEMNSARIEFPKDHCFHTNDNEWVYFSGVIETREGKEFGLMFTIFQFPGLRGGYFYPSMLGVSDPRIPRFYRAQTWCQNGTVGRTPDGLPWVDAGDSEFIWSSPDNLHLASSASTWDATSLFMQMDLKPTKDILLHGGDGFIPMADGIPSGYYSMTNLVPTNGTLTIGDQRHTIIGGRIWMDHQWGDWTAAAYAWDWFSLRFDDGGALMLFQTRDADEAVVGGNWTYRDKDDLVYYGTDFKVVAKRMVKNSPIDWTITLPSIEAEFEVKPLFDDQTFTGLWEGLCQVSGRVGTSQLAGQAFVELSGY